MSEPEPSSSARVGTMLRGKWTLERLLGEGGMASVFVARHKIGRVDAIKILHPAIASSPQLRARFEQEAHVVNRFRHPGAVEIRDIDTAEDGAPFIVMEFLEGETLSTIARRANAPLEVASVLRMADQVLDVLAAAHAQGIIHRDIKPDNLLLLTDGRVKVLDFGIARLRDSVNAKLKTSTGTTLGTVAYMPPEQAKGIDIDARVDLYAVGATMFRLLAGRRVHEADTEVERLMKVVSDPAPPLASVASEVPSEVCAVIDRALAFDRQDRYPDAVSMQADVRAVAGGGKPVHAATSARPATASESAEQGTRVTADVPLRRPASEAPTVGPRPGPQALPQMDESATRAQPGYVHDLLTVAAPPTSSPAPVTAPTVAAALAPPPVIPPAPSGPTPRRQAVPPGLVVAIAAGAMSLLLLIAAVVWLLPSARPDSASPEGPAATTPGLPAPAASPMAPFAPAQPTPMHGRGHHK